MENLKPFFNHAADVPDTHFLSEDVEMHHGGLEKKMEIPCDPILGDNSEINDGKRTGSKRN